MTKKRRARAVVEQEVPSNKQVLRATVFGGREVVRKSVAEGSAAEPIDPFSSMYREGSIVEPPFDPLTLTMLEEHNSQLRQLVDAMEINIEGFGGRIQMRTIPESVKTEYADEIAREREELESFLLLVNPDHDLTMLRRMLRRDIERVGYGFWELVPERGNYNKVAAIYHLEAHTMRITTQDENYTQCKKTAISPSTGKVKAKLFYKKFRRYVQIRNTKKVWFKEYGDPRIIDRRDGKPFNTEAEALAAGVAREYWAHTVMEFKLHSSRSPYGIPRYIGNLFSIFGSRASDEINYNTFLNNNIPNLAILVSGNAMLTDGTIKRIQDYFGESKKRESNASKVLLLEAESASDLPNSATPKVEIKPLKDQQHDDQLFQKYDANNAEKVRGCYRLPPIFIGQSKDYSRSTAETSRKLAEEQIFDPERREMDRRITSLFLDQGYKFWVYKSYSPNITNDEDIVRLLSSVEKTGALSPNFARMLVADILNREPEFYDKEATPFDPDIPFSLTMAEAVKGQAALGGNPMTGVLAPNQGQLPKMQPPSIPDKVARIQQSNEKVSKREIELLKEWEMRFDSYLSGAVPDDEVTDAINH